MSDATSATVFAEVFRQLATLPKGPKRAKVVDVLWNKSQDYDFSSEEMAEEEDTQKALKKLGLMYRGTDPDHPEDGKVWLYGPRPLEKPKRARGKVKRSARAAAKSNRKRAARRG